MVLASAIDATRTPPLSAVFFSQREFTIQVHPWDGAEIRILFSNAGGAFFKGFGVSRGPPVAEVALGVKLAAFVVEAVGEFVADDYADRSEVGGVFTVIVKERRL